MPNGPEQTKKNRFRKSELGEVPMEKIPLL